MVKKQTKAKNTAGATAAGVMMSFQDAVVRMFQKWSDFYGTATRPEYWWAMLFLFLVSIVTSWIPVIGVLITLALIVPQLSLTVRRLHDMGQSGKLLFGYLLVLPWMISMLISIFHGFGAAYAVSSMLFMLLFCAWATVIFIMTLMPTKTTGNKYRK